MPSFDEITENQKAPDSKVTLERVSMITDVSTVDIESRDGLAVDSNDRTVSIVVPCYNEIASIPNLADHLDRAIQELRSYDLDFVFVDDGSSDDTYEVLLDHFGDWENAQIIRHDQNQGLMAAIMTGVENGRGEIVCSIDSDCTYDPVGLVDLLPHLDEKVGAVTGSPYHPQGAILNVPKWRVWISYSASWLYRNILNNRLYCYTSSFRAYRKSAIHDIELQNGGFVGTTEILWKLEQRGWQIKEAPSILSVRQFGQSKIRIVQVAFDHLKLMKRILFSKFRGVSEKQEEVTCSSAEFSQTP